VTDNLKMDKLMISEITSDKPIHIYGGITMTGMKTSKPLNFDSFIVSGYEQWALVEHDHFDDEKSVRGWNLLELSSCDSAAHNKMLGGHGLTSSKKLSKTYTDLPPHTLVRIKANYHMLDNWEGEHGFMKADDQTLWKKKGISPKGHQMLNQCGNKDHADPLMNRQIDKILAHTGNSLKLDFGSTLQKNPSEASYGVDDVMIFVR